MKKIIYNLILKLSKLINSLRLKLKKSLANEIEIDEKDFFEKHEARQKRIKILLLVALIIVEIAMLDYFLINKLSINVILATIIKVLIAIPQVKFSLNRIYNTKKYKYYFFGDEVLKYNNFLAKHSKMQELEGRDYCIGFLMKTTKKSYIVKYEDFSEVEFSRVNTKKYNAADFES